MKKTLFALISAVAVVMSLNVQAAELKEGEQYVTVAQNPSAQPEVIEFFSFYCQHCYSFEMQYKIPEKVKAELPQGTIFKQYHVDFLGHQSENLTRAWALAMALGVESKVKQSLFESAQANALRSMDDIRQKFIDNGITAEQFDGGINSFAVNALVKKQQNLAEQFKVQGVPDFYVNGKYRVNPEGLSHDDFVGDYIKTTIELLKK
ncbi:thiol:disulfide interchange protein [Actinobacillus succinogenes]|uniref:Thiol:disulfide interchange protein n=1 Tax=Actinobacillus succinogenes (strain ATCC 55618 / DSM 22257 / CCUG 43843 / 130Z) TaxID=339671 RepID=A6VL39_ACTSZ|nr:DsbA family protein [Actinobacillus succinogenes]ABR73686.1 DSBA oxidoreductase [Actinobacillus succinogenes 130Z]PHI39855.1 thiol:disulfide interchange protein [Actinobacillus succinogenes]